MFFVVVVVIVFSGSFYLSLLVHVSVFLLDWSSTEYIHYLSEIHTSLFQVQYIPLLYINVRSSSVFIPVLRLRFTQLDLNTSPSLTIQSQFKQRRQFSIVNAFSVNPRVCLTCRSWECQLACCLVADRLRFSNRKESASFVGSYWCLK